MGISFGKRSRRGIVEMCFMNCRKMNENSRNKKISITIGALLPVLSVSLLVCAHNVPGFAQWYSINVYSVLVATVGRYFGWLPISAAEILLYILLAAVMAGLGWILCGIVKGRNVISRLRLVGTTLYFAAAFLFFLYVVNCGVNYQRDSFAYSAGLEIEAYSVEELETVCRSLTEDVNCLADQVHRDERGIMRLVSDEQEEAVLAMQKLAGTYPELQGYYPQPKGLMVPWILSVQQISGIYSPFTVEANYNSGMVDYNIPFTACHELSHLRGFMREEEANFIAYLACMESESPEFLYSGSLMGWVYCTNALYRNDYERWKTVRSELCDVANIDLKENSLYWDRYDGKTAELADKVNDNYLKANGQSEGIKSYGRMVDLMIAYYRRY